MFAIMSGQFIATSKFPATAFPPANIRLFSRVCPLVSFQMARFGISLGATVLGTVMNNSFALGP